MRETLELTEILDRKYQPKIEEEKFERFGKIDKSVEIYHQQLKVNPLYFKDRIQQYILNKKTYDVKSHKAIQKFLDGQTKLNEVNLTNSRVTQ